MIKLLSSPKKNTEERYKNYRSFINLPTFIFKALEILWRNFIEGLAFPFIFGKELKDHVLVNNWANGWKISSQSELVESAKQPIKPIADSTDLTGSTIYIIFWPQYLEFLGFGLLILSLIFVFKSSKI